MVMICTSTYDLYPNAAKGNAGFKEGVVQKDAKRKSYFERQGEASKKNHLSHTSRSHFFSQLCFPSLSVSFSAWFLSRLAYSVSRFFPKQSNWLHSPCFSSPFLTESAQHIYPSITKRGAGQSSSPLHGQNPGHSRPTRHGTNTILPETTRTLPSFVLKCSISSGVFLVTD